MNRKIEIIKNRSDLGAGTRGSDMGIDAIEIAAINKGSDFFHIYPHVDVQTHNEAIYDQPLSLYAKHIKEIFQQCTNVAYVVEECLRKHHFPLVFSGDHSSAMGTISGLKATFPQKTIGVVWVDAHADIHSPYTTPSGNMHGMPLAALLHQDNIEDQINEVEEETIKYWQKLKNLAVSNPKLSPDHLVYFGVRDTEEPEDRLIEKLHIKNFQVQEVRERGVSACLKELHTRLEGCDLIYISLDVDSMDSELISNGTGTPVPKGFTAEEVVELLSGLLQAERVACLEVVEVNPLLDNKGNKMAEVTFDILEKIVPLVSI